MLKSSRSNNPASVIRFEWGVQKDGVGLLWKSLSRNKKTVTLNLRLEQGRDLLRRLVAVSDVLIMNTRPGTLPRWRLSFEELRTINPELVMLHVTGFGAGGPYSDRPGFGTLGEAMSGFAHQTGQAEGPPTLPPFMLADGVAAQTAAAAVMTALYHRDLHGGGGQLIDISLVEPLARLLEASILAYDQVGTIATRTGNRSDTSVPRNTYRTRDGQWLAMSGSAPTVAIRVYNAIGRSDLAERPDYTDAQGRIANAEAIDQLVAEWVSTKSLAEALTAFEEHEVAVAPVYDAAQLLSDSHMTARGTYQRVADPELESMTVQVPVARLSDTPGRIEHLGRLIGENNDEVYQDLLGLSRSEMAELTSAGVI